MPIEFASLKDPDRNEKALAVCIYDFRYGKLPFSISRGVIEDLRKMG